MHPSPRAYSGPPGRKPGCAGRRPFSSSCVAAGLQTIIFLIVAIGMNIRIAFVGSDWKP